MGLNLVVPINHRRRGEGVFRIRVQPRWAPSKASGRRVCPWTSRTRTDTHTLDPMMGLNLVVPINHRRRVTIAYIRIRLHHIPMSEQGSRKGQALFPASSAQLDGAPHSLSVLMYDIVGAWRVCVVDCIRARRYRPRASWARTSKNCSSF